MIGTLTVKAARVLRDEGVGGLQRKLTRAGSQRLTSMWHWMIAPPRCKVCGARTRSRNAYGRIFYECQDCEFIFAIDYDNEVLHKGMGMEGSWSGPGGGGYREYYLAKMMMRDLGCKSFLLYGTGNTPTFATLREEGLDVIGCDTSPDVVEYKRTIFGDDSFFTPEDLPADIQYDGIIAVEVFEHIAEPKYTFPLLMGRLRPHGVICGTTNFYLGAGIEDSNSPGYMSLRQHVAYWSLRSMSRLAQDYRYAVAAFELVRPGSVLPDEDYGQLWPNKRVFFVYDPQAHRSYFEQLLKNTQILPIDRP